MEPIYFVHGNRMIVLEVFGDGEYVVTTFDGKAVTSQTSSLGYARAKATFLAKVEAELPLQPTHAVDARDGRYDPDFTG